MTEVQRRRSKRAFKSQRQVAKDNYQREGSAQSSGNEVSNLINPRRKKTSCKHGSDMLGMVLLSHISKQLTEVLLGGR